MNTIAVEHWAHIREKLLANVVTQPQEPELFAMVGIPASGKTTFIQKNRAKLPENHYFHDPDRIMEEMPGYQADLEKSGLEVAKENWELPCRQFADLELFPEAIRNRFNIVMDMGLCRSEIIGMIETALNAGYQLSLHIIFCEIDEALRRSRNRSIFVSELTIKQRAVFLSGHIDRILALANTVNAFDNSRELHPFQPMSAEFARERILSDYGLCSTG